MISTGRWYPLVYAVRFEGAVYVLHAFEKKSKRGIATPKADMEVTRARLKAAGEHHLMWKSPT
jgi:phage-related protein